MNAPTAAEISQQLEKIESLIGTSKRFIEEGKMVDLGSLEEKIRTLTDGLKQCDQQTAKPFLDPLSKLIDSLDEIEKTLEASRQNIEKTQSELEHKKARNAYQKSKKTE
ncbi:MAG: hypothetical protein OEY84_00450 [Rhodospirillaceae bacterium]|nr:hypothetical protein [Rhodospirillaceae bacterium]